MIGFDIELFRGHVGDVLREQREAREWTQADTAAEVGHSSAEWLSQIENGKRGVSLPDFAVLCNIFELDAAEVLDEALWWATKKGAK